MAVELSLAHIVPRQKSLDSSGESAGSGVEGLVLAQTVPRQKSADSFWGGSVLAVASFAHIVPRQKSRASLGTSSVSTAAAPPVACLAHGVPSQQSPG